MLPQWLTAERPRFQVEVNCMRFASVGKAARLSIYWQDAAYHLVIPDGKWSFRNCTNITFKAAKGRAASYNQGQKSLDRLSLFSFIHPFTVLILIFCQFSDGIVTPNSCIQMHFSLPTPCFNVALNSASTMWINTENGERGKSLVITPQWSNTFGPDYSLKAA